MRGATTSQAIGWLFMASAGLLAAPFGTACRSLPEPGAELAPPGADSPDDFEGELEEGGVYAAELRFDADSRRWVSVIPLETAPRETARIDWMNLADFPALANVTHPRARVVLEVVSRDAHSEPDQPTTLVSWACRVLSAR